MPLEALYTTISEQIVPPMAVAEAQGVIIYFLFVCSELIEELVRATDLKFSMCMQSGPT